MAIQNRPDGYHVWSSMKKRCTNINSKDYPRYGGRGIFVCKKWSDSFDSFISDMGPRPTGFSIDRIDNDKGYTRSNCRWASHHTQVNNRSSNVKITNDGETLTASQWSRRLDINLSSILSRSSRGKCKTSYEILGMVDHPLSRSKFLTYSGYTKSLIDWASEIGITRGCLQNRVDRGWSTGEALGFIQRKRR